MPDPDEVAAAQDRYTNEVVPIDKLDLDPRNPRLRHHEEGLAQDALLGVMIERFKIDELAESILSGGFRDFDPIVGVRSNGRVIVREGNRRVATLKLLLDASIAPPKYKAKWEGLSERFTGRERERVRNLAVRVYLDSNDPDLAAYIGFRHVTGVLTWPSLEKAEFIARLVEGQQWSYAQIAEHLGSYPKHVERHYVAYRLVQQAEAEGIEGSEQMRSSFGVLLRALQASGVMEFLGVGYPGDPQKSHDPVPADHVGNFRDFVLWTFGTNDKQRLLPDSRRLTDWGQILQSAEAVNYLRRTPNPTFDRASIKSGGQAKSVADAIFTAAYRLEESVPLVSELKEDVDVKEAVAQVARFFSQILRYFPDVAQRYPREI